MNPNQESKKGKELPAEEIKTIASLYLATLELPAHKSDSQIIICPVGLVGSGKTTVVKPLSQQLNLVRLSTDEIRLILKDKGYNWEKTFQVGEYVILNILKTGHSIALDLDCAGHRSELEALAEKFDYKLVWIHINPPEEYILNKLHNLDKINNDHPKIFNPRSVQSVINNYQRRKVLHQKLDFPFVYTFDPSQSGDLARQVKEAVQIIEAIK